MFGIGFSQLMLIALVALIVIGPERLPKVARSLGILFGRAQRFARDVKNQVEQDMRLEELSQLKQDAENSMRTVERSVQEQVFGIEKQVHEASRSLETELNAAVAAHDPTPPSGKLPVEPGNSAPDVSAPPASQPAPIPPPEKEGKVQP